MKYIGAKLCLIQLIVITSLFAMDDDAKNNPHFAYARHVLEEHLKNLAEFDSIIDVGCRDGITTHYLYTRSHPKKTSKIIGLDPSLPHIINAKTRQVAHLLQSAKTASTCPQQLARQTSFSSSPVEESTLSSSFPLEINLEANTDQYPTEAPLEDNSFYQRAMTPGGSSAQISTSLIHIQDVDSRDRLEFYVDNLVYLSYKESRAKLITSFNNLHTFHDKERFFNNICSLFKDNGTLLMTTQLESNHTKIILELLQRKVTETPWKQAFQNFYVETEFIPLPSIDDLKALLRKYYFYGAQITIEERYCASMANVSSYLEQEFNAFRQFSSLSSAQKKQLCDSIAQEYMRYFPIKNDSIPLPDSIIVKAQRHVPALFSGIGWIPLS